MIRNSVTSKNSSTVTVGKGKSATFTWAANPSSIFRVYSSKMNTGDDDKDYLAAGIGTAFEVLMMRIKDTIYEGRFEAIAPGQKLGDYSITLNNVNYNDSGTVFRAQTLDSKSSITLEVQGKP